MKHLKLFEDYPFDRPEEAPEEPGIYRIVFQGGRDEDGNDIMIIIEGSEDNEELTNAELESWAENLYKNHLSETNIETVEDMLELVDFIQDDLEEIEECGYRVRFSWKEWENIDMEDLRRHIDQALDQNNKEKFQRLSKKIR